MAIISSTLLLRTLSLFHLTAAYFLLTNPSHLTTQNFVLVLGASMRLPDASPSSVASQISSLSATPHDCLSTPNAAAALCGLFLGFLGLADLTATGLQEFAYDEYWSAQASVRMAIWSVVSMYVYLYGRGKGEIGAELLHGRRGGGFGGELQNGLVFTLGFMETMIMFWVHRTLSEERGVRAVKFAEMQKHQGKS